MFGINFGAADQAAESLRKAAGDLRKQRSELQRKMDGLKAERNGLYLQALNKADAKQFLFDYIDAWSEQYLVHGTLDKLFLCMAKPNREAGSFDENLTGALLCLRDIEVVLAPGGILNDRQVFGKSLPVFGAVPGEMIGYIGSACFFFGDLVKAKLGQYFDARYPEPSPNDVGAPVAERRVLIHTLDSQIGELQDAIGQINDKLDQLGISEPRRLPGGVQ